MDEPWRAPRGTKRRAGEARRRAQRSSADAARLECRQGFIDQTPGSNWQIVYYNCYPYNVAAYGNSDGVAPVGEFSEMHWGVRIGRMGLFVGETLVFSQGAAEGPTGNDDVEDGWPLIHQASTLVTVSGRRETDQWVYFDWVPVSRHPLRRMGYRGGRRPWGTGCAPGPPGGRVRGPCGQPAAAVEANPAPPTRRHGSPRSTTSSVHKPEFPPPPSGIVATASGEVRLGTFERSDTPVVYMAVEPRRGPPTGIAVALQRHGRASVVGSGRTRRTCATSWGEG